MFYYSTALFDGVLSSPLLGSTLVALVNTVATYAAVFLMDRIPHRALLLLSTGGMLVSIVLLTLTQLGFLHSTIALISIMAFVSFFEIGIGNALRSPSPMILLLICRKGPIPWLFIAESFEVKYVASASKAFIIESAYD